jgi:hypothetical protein
MRKQYRCERGPPPTRGYGQLAWNKGLVSLPDPFCLSQNFSLSGHAANDTEPLGAPASPVIHLIRIPASLPVAERARNP